MKEKLKSTKGITLIALVVTIIILIILAGISINLIFGQTGIINRAKYGQNEYYKAQAREKLELELVSLAADKNIENKNSDETLDEKLSQKGFDITGNYVTVDGWKFEIDRNTLVIISDGTENKDIQNVEEMKGANTSANKDITLEDGKGNKIFIPKGFKLASDSGSTVQQGIVIEDDSGNQYVWVPVSKDNTKLIYKDDGTTFINLLARRDFGTIVDEVGDVAISGYFGSCYTETISNTSAKNLTEFLQRSKDNGGFYIGRYEAGKDENGNLIISSLATQVYNNVTQETANNLAKAKFNDSTSEWTSDLVNSFAWGTTVNYMMICSNNSFNPTELKTYGGSNTMNHIEDACKIYDIISNHSEFSTEYCSYYSYNRVTLGGNYTGEYGNDSAKGRSAALNSYSGDVVSFRVILY